MNVRHAAALIVLCLITAAGCSRESASPVTTGLAGGDIRFENPSAAVTSYLNSHTVEPDPGDAVKFYAAGNLFSPQTSDYAVSGAVDPVASYTMTPVIDDADTFSVELSSMRFSGVGVYRASYRFGSRFPGSPALISCGPVTPEGVVCNIAECAGLVTATVKLVGDPAAIEALDPTFPVACTVSASVNEGPGSPSLSLQASAGDADLRETLTGDGLDIPLLARGLGAQQPLTLRADCLAKPVAGEERFPMDPDTGLTALVMEGGVALELACGDSQDVVLEVPVSFGAGNLTGFFDISGEDESQTEVRFEVAANLSTAPDPVPADQVPTDAWELNSMPVGDFSIYAQALVADNRKLLRLPFTKGANGLVTIAENQTTELGARFVARPHRLTGQYQLYDPAGLTDLVHLQTGDFASFGSTATAFMQAEGLAFQGLGGGDGVGGLARSVFDGTYDASLGRSDLSYELLIGGLSPINGALDGTSALTTPWRVNRSFFRFVAPDDNRQDLWINPRDNLSYNAVSGGADAVPLQQICFGQHALTLRSDPEQFLLYSPRADIDSSGEVAGSADLPGAGYSLSDSDVFGFPRNLNDRADEATLRATLPEGLVYTIHPNVRIVTPDGSDTRVNLQSFETQGALTCGQVVGHCLEINDVEGSYSGLTIGVDPELPYCNDTGNLEFGIVVDSTNQDVNYLRTRVFSQEGAGDQVVAETFHCAPCGPNPEYSFSAPLTAGAYRLQIDAGSGTGTCEATFEAPFVVPEEPLALHCPDDFQVTLPGEAQSISSADPLIADPLVASTSGGCGFEVPIADDRPAEFLQGETIVNFSAAGLSCATTVTVLGYGGAQIAFLTGETLRVHDIATGDVVHSLAMPGLAHTTAFSADGRRIAVAPAGAGNAALLYDFDSGNFEAVPGDPGVAVSFSPVDSANVAIVAYQANQFTLSVRTPGGVSSDTFIAGPDASMPAVAWSPDGDRIALVRTTAYTTVSTPTILYRVRYKEYAFDGQNLQADPQASFNAVITPPPVRHEPFELVFVPGASPVYSSTSGFLRVLSDTVELIEMDVPGADGPAFDISNNGAGAAWGAAGTLYVIPDLTNLDPATLISGTTEHFQGKPELAVSNDMRLLALSKTDAVVVLSIPDFQVVRIISATEPKGLQFRPQLPE